MDEVKHALAAELARLLVAHEFRLMEQVRGLGVVPPDPNPARVQAAEVVEGGLVLLELEDARVGIECRLVIVRTKRDLAQHEQRAHDLLLGHGFLMLVVMCMLVMMSVVVLRHGVLSIRSLRLHRRCPQRS